MLTLGSAFSVIDSHTAGHPTRVVLSGIPRLAGASVLANRDAFRRDCDHLRPMLLHEPRGHAAMVALIPVPSSTADYGAFFVSSYVYLDMCGHATIGYAKTLAAMGELTPKLGDRFTLETPAGIVSVDLAWGCDGELAQVRLTNVPSRIGMLDFQVQTEPFGIIAADIVYGGMWYALVDAAPLGLDLAPDKTSELLRAGSLLKGEIKAALAARPEFMGVEAPSVLFYRETGPNEAVHFLVLDINKFDRSPCGTGTSARVAAMAARGTLAPGAPYIARNILGASFQAFVTETRLDGSIVVAVEGIAHITAHSTIVVETGDPLAHGFLCR